MGSETPQEYSNDEEILSFFRKTSATRSSCDARARELVGGTVIPVAVQGFCSYSVYAGPDHEFVVQFRLKSLDLDTRMTTLASQIHGPLITPATSHGQIGEDGVDGKEPLCVYVMNRVKGISHLDFILAHNVPENSVEWCTWRENLISDIAEYGGYPSSLYINQANNPRFFGQTWKHPQKISSLDREAMFQTYEKDLCQLHAALPSRFHPIIQQSIDALPAIFSLPMVLLHKDFGSSNVMVDADDNHLVGVIDWAEAQIGPYGTNLHSLQQFMSKYRLRVGWIRHANYETMDRIFWEVLSTSAGGLNHETIQNIKASRVVVFYDPTDSRVVLRMHQIRSPSGMTKVELTE
ncbi:hypothetical protein N7466_002859 [Penicillium verhagenii]|uniref:uncharacterized protein n=1 Tax=Penicillium verhagenii TaxID=1562060 RepID=UPI002545AD5D|nr:uncharacterized protein N7466_002859 [Penicillium verhagenii]KAJ5939725.1 hypothetical protein N7466_002859 [Penicillium verhagenii]